MCINMLYKIAEMSEVIGLKQGITYVTGAGF